jgi:hypothetical protein
MNTQREIFLVGFTDSITFRLGMGGCGVGVDSVNSLNLYISKFRSDSLSSHIRTNTEVFGAVTAFLFTIFLDFE